MPSTSSTAAAAKTKSKAKAKRARRARPRVMCFGCSKRRLKYVTGLCETCHRITVATDAALAAEAAASAVAVAVQDVVAKYVYVIPEDVLSLGEALRWLRQQQRMTIRQLAGAINISAVDLSDVEHNRRSLNDEEIVAAAEVLHTKPLGLYSRVKAVAIRPTVSACCCGCPHCCRVY